MNQQPRPVPPAPGAPEQIAKAVRQQAEFNRPAAFRWRSQRLGRLADALGSFWRAMGAGE